MINVLSRDMTHDTNIDAIINEFDYGENVLKSHRVCPYEKLVKIQSTGCKNDATIFGTNH